MPNHKRAFSQRQCTEWRIIHLRMLVRPHSFPEEIDFLENPELLKRCSNCGTTGHPDPPGKQGMILPKACVVLADNQRG